MSNPLIPEPLAYPNQSGVPRIVLTLDIAASFLRENCVDVSAIINGSKTAVAEMVSAHAAAPLLLAEVSAAAAVPGTVNVRGVTIDGDPADLTTFAGSLPVLPNMIVVDVGSIN
jgi:hypothetical protein